MATQARPHGPRSGERGDSAGRSPKNKMWCELYVMKDLPKKQKQKNEVETKAD